uniref:Membrane-associated progesterone receptor component 2 n=1 Tax=Aceria tosichella TaxID=561515 RepID=A0A6G1S4X9_9ACAR
MENMLQNIVEPSPLNIFLTAICIGLVYLIYKSANDKKETKSEFRKELEPFPRGDMTLGELRKYDGKSNEEGRILMAVNREIYDVTKGSRFYGPEGPYATLAGHDATRALALFAVDAVKEEWDDYSDLNVSQMSTVNEWLEQFKEKYDYVGKLVKTDAEKSTPVEPTDEEPDD